MGNVMEDTCCDRDHRAAQPITSPDYGMLPDSTFCCLAEQAHNMAHKVLQDRTLPTWWQLQSRERRVWAQKCKDWVMFSDETEDEFARIMKCVVVTLTFR